MEMKSKKLRFLDETNSIVEFSVGNSFNQGSERGSLLLKKSIQKLGLGRGVLVDNDNNVISGEKIMTLAHDEGLKKVRVIEVSGDELVVVKRTDVKYDTTKGHELALVDNLSQSKNLEWNVDKILNTMDKKMSFDPRNWGGYECVIKELNIEDFLKEEVERQFGASKKVRKEKDEFIENNMSLFDYE